MLDALKKNAPLLRRPSAGVGMAARAGREQVRHILYGPRPQTQLTVAAPGDVYEQEADRVADAITRTPSGTTQRSETPSAQPHVSAALEGDITSMQGGGQPLPDATRTFFESHLDHDLTNVRVHTDPLAASAAAALSARAYTVGSDVAFAKGEFAPETSAGQRLLAHELAHVIQQTPAIRRSSAAPAAPVVETPETLAKAIRQAFRGAGTDEDEIYRVLRSPPATVRALINYYNDNLNDHTGQGLIADLQDELSGDELDRAIKLLVDAEVDTHVVGRVTAIPSTVPGEPDKRWVGLLVRGKWSEAHAPGVLEQHADVLITGASGGLEPVGYFGNEAGPGVSGMGLEGVSAEMGWFLAHRPSYVDLGLAVMMNVMTSLILLKVTDKQADTLAKYWNDLKNDPGTFNMLGSNCSTAAAAGFTKADVTKEIAGLDTPDHLFNQLKKEYPTAYMISGHFGYERSVRPTKWDTSDPKHPVVLDPGEGPWSGPYIVERRLS